MPFLVPETDNIASHSIKDSYKILTKQLSVYQHYKLNH